MTEHKFTDDDVIHHLDCYENLGYRWCGYAIALINRQRATLKALQMDNAQLQSDIVNANMNADHALAEIERLEKSLADQFDSYENIRKKAKSEAIKEFAKKIKEELDDFYYSNEDALLETADLIDTLVKEMTEESK